MKTQTKQNKVMKTYEVKHAASGKTYDAWIVSKK